MSHGNIKSRKKRRKKPPMKPHNQPAEKPQRAPDRNLTLTYMREIPDVSSTLPRPDPTVKKESPGRIREWWDKLSTGEKTLTIIGVAGLALAFLTLIVATAVVPEVRYVLHLEKRPESSSNAPDPPHTGPDQGPKEEPKEKDPEFKLIPMPEHKEKQSPVQRAQSDIDHKSFAKTAGGTSGVIGGLAGGSMGGLIGGIAGSHPKTMGGSDPAGSIETEQLSYRPSISEERAKGLLAYSVDPIYPTEAREKGISGQVFLHVVIGEKGKVEAISGDGDPMLVEAAKAAVKEWIYSPLVVDGKSIAPWRTVIRIDFPAEESKEKPKG
jgi:TonB family protein